MKLCRGVGYDQSKYFVVVELRYEGVSLHEQFVLVWSQKLHFSLFNVESKKLLADLTCDSLESKHQLLSEAHTLV